MSPFPSVNIFKRLTDTSSTSYIFTCFFTYKKKVTWLPRKKKKLFWLQQLLSTAESKDLRSRQMFCKDQRLLMADLRKHIRLHLKWLMHFVLRIKIILLYTPYIFFFLSFFFSSYKKNKSVSVTTIENSICVYLTLEALCQAQLRFTMVRNSCTPLLLS